MGSRTGRQLCRFCCGCVFMHEFVLMPLLTDI